MESVAPLAAAVAAYWDMVTSGALSPEGPSQNKKQLLARVRFLVVRYHPTWRRMRCASA